MKHMGETSESGPTSIRDGPAKGFASFCSKYLVALEVTLIAVPILAAVMTGMFYLLPYPSLTSFLSPEWYSIVGGGITTFMIWLVVALFISPFTTVDRADISQYSMLKSRLNWLQSYLKLIEERAKTDLPSPEEKGVFKVLCSYENDMGRMLSGGNPSLSWLLGKGYLSVWRVWHRAEETLIETETPDTLFGEVLRDRLRIRDAHMSNSEGLLQALTEAEKKIVPAAKSYMEKDQCSRVGRNQKSSNQAIDAWAYRDASLAVREVRRAFNEFKDSRWEALLALRNGLIIATVIAENATYLLVCLVIAVSVRQYILEVVLALYLVGALAGSFGRFYGEADHTFHSSNDYGLSVTRLVATPYFSGLAGVGGALVTSVLPMLSMHVAPVSDLVSVFQANPTQLFIAAVFGLTPNLIMRALKQQAEAQRPPGWSKSHIEGVGG